MFSAKPPVNGVFGRPKFIVAAAEKSPGKPAMVNSVTASMVGAILRAVLDRVNIDTSDAFLDT